MKQVTLLFLRKGNYILLAMKKRGFGAGKWNGVGGKAEPGETIEQTTIRETQEEIGVTPVEFSKAGELHFVTHPDIEHYCHIFVATKWEGDPAESEEMDPKWFHINDIPYASMWPDDSLWVPKLLADKTFRGKFVIGEQDEIIDHEI